MNYYTLNPEEVTLFPIKHLRMGGNQGHCSCAEFKGRFARPEAFPYHLKDLENRTPSFTEIFRHT